MEEDAAAPAKGKKGRGKGKSKVSEAKPGADDETNTKPQKTVDQRAKTVPRLNNNCNSRAPMVSSTEASSQTNTYLLEIKGMEYKLNLNPDVKLIIN